MAPESVPTHNRPAQSNLAIADNRLTASGTDQTDRWNALENEEIDCRLCPRLVDWREQVAREKRRAYRASDYWGRPVPGLGDPNARVLIVGLAPGAHGSNRTGQMFTGDSSGDTLYAALHRSGFASQPFARERGDGLVLTDVFITAIVRCVPPGNRPTTNEIAACRPFLVREWQLLSKVQVILALGQIAWDACLRTLRDQGHKIPKLKFQHASHYQLENSQPESALQHIVASYHPSRQNTQTGRLTVPMFNQVFDLTRSLLD